METLTTSFKNKQGIPPTLGNTYPGGRKIIGGAFEMNNVPKNAIPTIIASISDGTIKQYDTCYKKWWEFCSSQNIQVYENNISQVIEFLKTELDNNYSYATINSYRSALNLIIKFRPNDEAIIKRFLKGVFNTRPPKPKYAVTWDPQIVLSYLEKLHPLSSLNIEKLTLKLTTLLALATAHRAQTLSKITVDNIIRFENKIEIRIPQKIKTTGPNRLQPNLVLPYLKQNPALCVASTLSYYIENTQKTRDQTNVLLLTHKQPFRPATSQTISRWIKTVLNECGIDTNIFKSHSVRHAATSAAFRGGVNLDTIYKTAGWTERSSVFANFYNRPLSSDLCQFANSVLSFNKNNEN